MTAGASYFDRVNPATCSHRIPVGARAVLEVGCGAGALGAAFKAIRPEWGLCGPGAGGGSRQPGRRPAGPCAGGRCRRSGADAAHLPPLDCLIYGDLAGAHHLLPLADTPFNRCKSDLKALEAGGHDLAILASPVVYGGSLLDGETGRLYSREGRLEEILQGWLADPVAAQAMGLRARRWVAGSRMQQQTLEREAW